MVAIFDAGGLLRQSASRPLVRGAFAAANLARSFVWCFAEMFLAYHLRSAVGLSSAQTSLTLVILLMIGAATDLAAGFLLRRYNSSRAIVLGAQRVGAVLVAIALVPLFLPGIGLAGALFWGCLFRAAFSFYAVPQATLLSILPADQDDQRLYVTMYSALGAVARPITALLALLIVNENSPFALGLDLGWVLAIALFCVASALVLEYAVRTRGALAIGSTSARQRESWPVELNWILAATAFHAGALYMMSRLFLFTAAPSDGRHTGAWLLILWSLGLAAGPLIRMLSRKSFFPFAVTAAGIFACMILLTSTPLPVRLGAALLYGATLSASGADLLGAIARVTTDRGGTSGGMAFAAFAVVIKVAMALGNGALAFLLDGYSTNASATIAALVVIHVGGAVCCVFIWRRERPSFARCEHKNLPISRLASIADRAA